MTAFAARLTRAWYARNATALAQALRPLSWLFGGAAALRRAAYRSGALRRVRMPVPVVVVGNLTVGGAGKTPLVVALVSALGARGWRPGVVSRGYGRRSADVRVVHVDGDPLDTGDEPLLLAATGVPVFVGADRAAAAQALLAAHRDVDVIVADDGLQHYALARDVEIAVVDDARGFGNGLLLPAGPLRESPSRLASVDAVVRLAAVESRSSGREPDAVAIPRATWSGPREFEMTHEAQAWRNLADPHVPFEPATLRDPSVVAIAGIADPDRFFGALRAQGFAGTTRAFPDHHRYSREDVAFPRARAILMTEKDAVKCRAFADMRMWMLPIRARVDPALIEAVVEKLDGSQAARNAGLPGHQGTADPRP